MAKRPGWREAITNWLTGVEAEQKSAEDAADAVTRKEGDALTAEHLIQYDNDLFSGMKTLTEIREYCSSNPHWWRQ